MCDCNCQLVTYDSLDEAIYSGKKRLFHLTGELLRHYTYGYDCNAQKTIDKISLYIDSVERYRVSFLAGEENCLSCNEFQTILEELKTLTSDCDMRARMDQTVDTSQRDTWVALNPYCAPKERWQQLALKVCSDLKFNIKIEDKSEKLLCNLLYIVAVHGGKACEIDYSVKIDMKQCKAEYDVLVKDKDCTLTFGEYVNLKKCGITFETIAEGKDCGIEFGYNFTEECPDIKYGTRSCPLNQITIDSSTTQIQPETVRCLFNEDSMGCWVDVGCGAAEVGDGTADINVNSLVFDGTEYVPVPTTVTLGANITIPGVGLYNTWLVDFINDLGIEGFTASNPTEEDVLYVESVKFNPVVARSMVVITRTQGTQFSIQYDAPFIGWNYVITDTSSETVEITTCAASEDPGVDFYLWCPVCT